MDTFEFEVSKKDLDGASAIFKLNRFLHSLLKRRMDEEKMTKAKLAVEMGLDKSTVSRMLRGNQNLTFRTFGEILGALDFDFDLTEKDLKYPSGNSLSAARRQKDFEITPATSAGKSRYDFDKKELIQ